MDPHSSTFWILAVIASALVGLSKGGLPVVGMLAVPIMALKINPLMAAGLLLPVYVISDMFGLYAYRHQFSMTLLKILVPATALGVALGYATASLVPEWIVTALIGAIGLAFSLNLLLRRSAEGPAKPAAWGPGLFWGALTGYTSFISHSGAPPYQVYVLPQRLEKMVFAGTTTVLFAWVNAIKLIPYWMLGQINLQSLKDAALLMVPAVLAVFAGVRLVRVIPEKLFFQLVTWALLLVSARLLWEALSSNLAV